MKYAEHLLLNVAVSGVHAGQAFAVRAMGCNAAFSGAFA